MLSIGFKARITITLLLMFNISNLSAQSWQTTLIHDGDDLYLSMALDSEGNPHISFIEHIEYGNRPLKYAKWNGSSWEISTVFNHVGDVGGYTSIAIDEQDNPHISFYGNLMLKYAHWTGSSWIIETVDSGYEDAIGLFTSIALDSEGNPHFSYISTWFPEPWKLKYAFWTGSNWQIEILDTFDQAWIYDVYNSMVLDSNDNPHIAYNNGYDGVDMMYVFGDGTAWQYETVDTDGETGVDPSIALNANETPCIAYYNRTTGQLRYASRINSEWELQSIEFIATGKTGIPISLAFDKDNFPNIAYFSAFPKLKFAAWDGSSWSTEIACDFEYSGYYASLAIDDHNNKHIAHYEWYYGTLYHTQFESPLSSENDILTFSVPEQSGDTEINYSDHTVHLYVEVGTSLTALTPTITISDNATIDPESGTTLNFIDPFVYTVTAENSNEQEWTVTISVLTSNNDNLINQHRSLVISPNPAKDNVKIKSDNTIEEIRVYNLHGQLVNTEKNGDKTHSISTSEWDAGIYIVEVHTNNNIQFGKIIKK